MANSWSMQDLRQRLFRRPHRRKRANHDVDTAFSHGEAMLPTLWLLGKTGAGKSTLIQALTGQTDIALGRGFKPCTRTAQRYPFPADKPIVAFLDTRGLAEAHYDASADMAVCEATSHALLLVMRAPDQEQSQVLQALRQIRRAGRIHHAVLVHTAIQTIASPQDRARCIQAQHAQVQAIWGDIASVAVDVYGHAGNPVGLDELVERCGALLPIVSSVFARQRYTSEEERNFQAHKRDILWYAAAAGAGDAVPLLGLVAVPGVQTRMLQQLAQRHGLRWNRRLLAEFGAALGIGLGVQYASRLGLQQLVKLIPAYGQTLGAASAAVASYSTTYALGRVACMLLYRRQHGQPTDPGELQARFRQAVNDIRPVARHVQPRNHEQS